MSRPKDEEEQVLVKNDEETEGRNKEQHALKAVRFLVVIMCNIFLWYFTNGFNGIAMQSYTKTVRSQDTHSEIFCSLMSQS